MSILKDNPQGRLDIAAVRVAEFLVRGPIEKACNGLPLWDWGMGRVVEAVVVQSGVPTKPIEAMDFARALGIVKKDSGSSANRLRAGQTGRLERDEEPEVINPPTTRRRYVRA